MQSSSRVFIFLLFSFGLNLSVAQANLCRQVFASPGLPANFTFREDRQALQALQAASEVAGAAQNQEQRVDALYLLATQANNVIDKIVDNIIILKSRKLSDFKVRAFQVSSSTLLNNLAAITNLDLKTLQQVVNVRFHEDMAQLMSNKKREQERASSIGYIEHKIAEGTQNSEEAVAIGFDLGQNQDDLLGESDETMPSLSSPQTAADQNAEKVSQGPVGFLDIHNSSQDEPGSSAREKVGFIHFANPSEDSKSRVQITLNMKTGIFDVQKPENPIGFNAP